MFKQSLSLLLLLSVLTTACSKGPGFYDHLGPQEDGVVSMPILDDGNDKMEPIERVPSRAIDQLSQKEMELVDRWHNGETGKLNFIVVDAQTDEIKKGYGAWEPQRLASVSKIPTALGALEEVRNVEVNKVARMLKNSHNGEASRYVRLAAKALDGLVLDTQHYTQKASCPSEFLNDQPASDIVFEWLMNEVPGVDWTAASINDGAGCHYDNFMSPIQIAKILRYADKKGEAYGGKAFEDLLSINGKDGTWKNRNPEHRGYIFAKTGTLNPNSNLAGYFYARRGGVFHRYYFAVLVQKRGSSATNNARKLIEELMRHWIRYYSAESGPVLGQI